MSGTERSDNAGGEHSLSYPFVKACKKKYPELGFVVLDAHMD